MAYTDEYDKRVYFGDLYELTVEEAAEQIYKGLWDSSHVTEKQILDALLEDIEAGNLKVVRGSIKTIGKHNTNPAILNAFKVAKWAEKNGLELESNGEWNDYMYKEAELSSILSEKLEALRAIQRSGKSLSEILNSQSTTEDNEKDKLITLLIENEELKNEQRSAYSENELNPKAMNSLLKIVSTMAVDGYAYNWTDKKSPVPAEISKAATDKLGESIDEDTVRRWLKISSDKYPPSSTKPK